MRGARNERYRHSDRSRARSLEPSVQGQGRYGLPDYCGVVDLHDFRCRVSLLCRKESHGADTARGARDAGLLHDLFVVQQSHDSLRVKISRTRQSRRFFGFMVLDDCSWRSVFVWHRTGMAPADLRARSDNLHESFWNDLLLARWPARHSRYGGSAHAWHRASVWPGGLCRPGAVGILWMRCGSSSSRWFTF